MFRGLAKTQVLGDGVEVADVTQFHGDAFYTSFFAKNQEAPTGKTDTSSITTPKKVQRFSWWMTSMLHRFAEDNAFDQRRQLRNSTM